MNELMNFYWDWGIFISGIFVFALGHLIGWHRHKEKVAREKKAEDLRIAIGEKKCGK